MVLPHNKAKIHSKRREGSSKTCIKATGLTNWLEKKLQSFTKVLKKPQFKNSYRKFCTPYQSCISFGVYLVTYNHFYVIPLYQMKMLKLCEKVSLLVTNLHDMGGNLHSSHVSIKDPTHKIPNSSITDALSWEFDPPSTQSVSV